MIWKKKYLCTNIGGIVTKIDKQPAWNLTDYYNTRWNIMMNQRLDEIPQIIHYIWFGNKPKSKFVRRCIASWHKYCPTYKIIEWNETNYNIKKNRYMYEAYKAKKWAFASDYARYDIVYHYGGIYLDTDVELVAGLDNLLHDKMFMGFLESQRVNSGLGFGSVKGNPILKEMLQYYGDRSFYKQNGEMDLRVCNHNETLILVKHGLIRNGEEQQLDYAHIYPVEYFNPAERIPVDKTIAVHYGNGSWTSPVRRSRKRKNIFLEKRLNHKNAILAIRLTDRVWDTLEKIEQLGFGKMRENRKENEKKS